MHPMCAVGVCLSTHVLSVGAGLDTAGVPVSSVVVKRV
jgi:hypothetical protein